MFFAFARKKKNRGNTLMRGTILLLKITKLKNETFSPKNISVNVF